MGKLQMRIEHDPDYILLAYEWHVEWYDEEDNKWYRCALFTRKELAESFISSAGASARIADLERELAEAKGLSLENRNKVILERERREQAEDLTTAAEQERDELRRQVDAVQDVIHAYLWADEVEDLYYAVDKDGACMDMTEDGWDELSSLYEAHPAQHPSVLWEAIAALLTAEPAEKEKNNA